MAATSLYWHGFPRVTTAAVAVAAAVHATPGGRALAEVALNPRRVLLGGEWRRLATAPLVHWSLPHLLTSLTSLANDGAALEAAVGPAEMAATLASVGALSQGLYSELGLG